MGSDDHSAGFTYHGGRNLTTTPNFIFDNRNLGLDQTRVHPETSSLIDHQVEKEVIKQAVLIFDLE